MTILYWLDILGTVVFAISGVLVAARKKMDPIGALVLGIITAIGGGTIRDIVLDNGPAFWLIDSTDLVVAILSSILTMLVIRYSSFMIWPWLFSVLDAIGLAVFVGIGVNKAAVAAITEANGIVMVGMGVMTGVGGGILRDVLARDIPMVFRAEIYATACILGGSAQVVLYLYLGQSLLHSMLIGMAMTLFIRLAAIYWRLKLPVVSRKEKSRL